MSSTLLRSAAAGFRPDPILSLVEWSDTHRELSSKEASESGRWRTSRTPYLAEIMECLSVTSPVERVVFMKGSQIGGSEVGINWIGYVIQHAPGPMLNVQPTLKMLQRFSRQRITPLIESTEVLRGLVPAARSQEGGNKLDTKEFPGGILIMATAGSAIEMASMPVRYLCLEEVDRYETNVDGEGHPVEIAEQRTATYRVRRKIYLNSTPRRPRAYSIIAQEYDASDRRRFWIPCGMCGAFQVLKWEQVKIPEGRPDRAVYECASCSQELSDARRINALQDGNWRAEADFHGTAGFHLSSLYSPWVRIAELARKFERARKRPEKKRTFVNIQLGETFEEEGEQVDPTDLFKRREAYAVSPLPEGVVVITAAADIQPGRFELEFVGWGLGEENWSIDYAVVPGDATSEAYWTALDEQLQRKFMHPLGEELAVVASCVDSGGHNTRQVYDFCRARWARRVWAVKGVGGENVPLFEMSKKVAWLMKVGADAGKTRVAARLGVAQPGPGYCHFPTRYGQDYFDGLTAEKLVTRYVKGFPRRAWEKDPTTPNEPLDVRVYNTVAFAALNPAIEVAARQLRERAEARNKPAEPPPPIPPRHRRRGGFGTNW